MSHNIGAMRKRLQIQQRSSTTEATFGQQQLSWVTILSVWGEIAPLSGVQLAKAQSIYNEVSHEITVRWQPALEDVRKVGAYRVLYSPPTGDRYFDIGASLNENEMNRWVSLLCKEGLNEGG